MVNIIMGCYMPFCIPRVMSGDRFVDMVLDGKVIYCGPLMEAIQGYRLEDQ